VFSILYYTQHSYINVLLTIINNQQYLNKYHKLTIENDTENI